MKTVGIICEYNPLHLGHEKQLQWLKAQGHRVVCIMSGNYVQRGQPAILDKGLRARAAVTCGADLVLELPLTAAVSSAERFAAEGVRLLAPICDGICFGAENADREHLMAVAKALLSEDFSAALRLELDKGLSFPGARQKALQTMGLDGALLETPNNILAVEYCKAITAQGLKMEPMPIHRGGDYHAQTPDPENPSATAVRGRMGEGTWQEYVPTAVREIYQNATLHTLAAGERAVLCKLRTMTDEEFEALPYGSEGLWRKLMHAAREQATLEQIATAVKSKRYTRSRIDRMILCAFLGLSEQDLTVPSPYARVLAFNDEGRNILKIAKDLGHYPNIGEKIDHPYQKMEDRAEALYGLFAQTTPEAPTPNHRIYYAK